MSASFVFGSGVVGSGTWCFTVSRESQTDEIEIVGSKGKITFSTFAFTPIRVESESGYEAFDLPRPDPIQEPMIQTVVDELLGCGLCPGTAESASRTTRVMEEILKEYYSSSN